MLQEQKVGGMSFSITAREGWTTVVHLLSRRVRRRKRRSVSGADRCRCGPDGLEELHHLSGSVEDPDQVGDGRRVELPGVLGPERLRDLERSRDPEVRQVRRNQ